jgi:hypothetical protein
VDPLDPACWLGVNPGLDGIPVDLGCLCDHLSLLMRVLGDVLPRRANEWLGKPVL